MLFRYLRVLPLLLGMGFPALVGQNIFPFHLTVQQTGLNPVTVANNSTITLLSSAVGRSVTVTVTVIYVGATQATISTDAQLIGPTSFSITHLTKLPLILQPNESFTVDLTFTATTSGTATAQLSIPYVEAAAAAGKPPTGGNILLTFTGQSPQFTISYSLASNGNVIGLTDGATIQFQSTPVNTSSLANVNITNVGGGPGVITSISLTGAAFQTVSLPLLPIGVNPGGTLQFQIRYTPVSTGADQGTLKVTFADGSMVTVNLQGTSVTSNFTYTLVSGTDLIPLTPGQTIKLPDTKVGQSQTFTVQVQNTSQAAQTITLAVLSGTGFTFTNPPVLPAQLAPGGTYSFSFTFTPTVPGTATATLRINSDLFTFTDVAIGPQLTYTYTVGSTVNTVAPAGTVSFGTVPVGQTTTVQFTVKNTGTAPATVSSIGVSGGASNPTSNVFSSVIPSLPVTLDPNASLTFSINFTPVTTGQATGTLVIDAAQFTLSGFGSNPPPLPSFQITGPTGTVKPFDQVTVGITLSQPYPLPLKGTLVVRASSDSFSNDPAVQFSTGGTTTTFTIPANQTQAVFANGATQLRLQTGTVSGTLTIIPTFATQAGSLDITPANVTPLTIVIPRLAPVLLTSQLGASTATGFSIAVTGYSTTRIVSKLDVQITPTAGTKFANNTFSIPVDQASALWFNNGASQTFGGQFTITIPFTLSSSDTAVLQTAFLKIGSVTVTATNDVGTSNAVTLALH